MMNLFEKTSMNGLWLKNRLIRSATGENLATAKGNLPKELINTYIELAQGGVGAIILGFTSVAAVDHFRKGLMRLHDDCLIPEYQNLVKEVHKYNCVTLVQLALGIYLKETQTGQYAEIKPNDMTRKRA